MEIAYTLKWEPQWIPYVQQNSQKKQKQRWGGSPVAGQMEAFDRTVVGSVMGTLQMETRPVFWASHMSFQGPEPSMWTRPLWMKSPLMFKLLEFFNLGV